MSDPRRRPPFAFPWWGYLLIFAVAFAVRFVGVSDVDVKVFDEALHVPGAYNFMRYGRPEPDTWYSPPQRQILQYAALSVFGDNPYGWRMLNVFAGALTVLLLFAAARRIFRTRPAAWIAASLLLLDPLHVSLSRSTNEVVVATLFMLAGVLAAIHGTEEDEPRFWALAGLLFGLAVASRWFCLGAVTICLAFAVHRYRGNRGRIALAVSFMAVLPLVTYLPWYIPWLARGYSFPELLAYQYDILRYQASFAGGSFNPLLQRLGNPIRWFVMPIGVMIRLGGDATRAAFGGMMGDPAIWVLIVPSVTYLAFRGWKNRLHDYLVIAGCFLLPYLFFLTSPRPIFLYDAVALLPFGFMAVGLAANRLLSVRHAYWFLGAVTAWGLFVYPLVTWKMIPIALYQPLLWGIQVIGG